MATKKKSMGKKTAEPRARQVRFSVEPGTKVNITLEVGEEMVDGKVPLTVHIEEVGRDPIPAVEIAQPEPIPVPEPVVTPARRWARFEALRSRLQAYDLATWLFIFAVAVYLLTRLIGLTKFPIYFFSDEAIQSLSMVDLIKNGYRDPSGVWF